MLLTPHKINDIPDDGISQETVLELMEDFDPESLAVIEQDSQQERQTMLLEEEVDEEEEELAELEMGSFLDIEEEMPEMEVR